MHIGRIHHDHRVGNQFHGFVGDAELLEDYRGRSLLVFSSYWAIDFTCRRNPGLKVSEIVGEEG